MAEAGPRPTFLAITGPTASGKTELSLAVAERLEVEIVSMDSRQVYRGMDIGTDKVEPADRARVRHHGLDLVDPRARYSAGRFARDARRWIEEIRGRGRVALLVGGTGFFLRSVVEPIFAEPVLPDEPLAALRSYLKRQPRTRMERWVRRLDPPRAELAIAGGPQRMSRTVEVALLTGRRLSWWHLNAPPEGEALCGAIVLLEMPREDMDRRIDDRVGALLERGLVEEVRRLLDAGYGPEDPGMTGTGYREIVRHLRGETSLSEAADEIRRNTRRYARRQLTWFRHQLPEGARRVSALAPMGDRVSQTVQAWANTSCRGGVER